MEFKKEDITTYPVFPRYKILCEEEKENKVTVRLYSRIRKKYEDGKWYLVPVETSAECLGEFDALQTALWPVFFNS